MIRVCATALNPVDVQMAGASGIVGTLLDWAGGRSTKVRESVGFVPGADVSGVVVAVGEGVGKWKVGGGVFGLCFSETMAGRGTNQEYIVAPATAPLVPKPANLSHVEAASFPLVFFTSYAGLVSRGGLDRNPDVNASKVLILGASGGTGIIALQIAKQLGAHIVAVCSGKNVDFVKQHGANEVIDYTTQDVVSLALSYGPYKIIYDCVGGTTLIPELSTLLAPKPASNSSAGVYITIVGDKTSRSLMGGGIAYLTHPRMLLRTLLGQVGLGPRYYCVNLSTGEEETSALLRWAAEGKIKAVIDGEAWGRDQVREAYGRLESGRARGKVVIDWEKE
ncbi:NAD(P)-binding protein [Ceratobasidium sp. AG-I]|nr:NAD(P)-binding protein [Ceratobasidium sp. AG-I]